ncbi:hypothetical protein BV61_01250 [Candidatus Synechococcus spongiarum LMB bulk15M]|uniref:Transposase IS4-like domain-containing protein n=1 Tax=Candidatus Synechococcus spongiarum LMB bulk15M TaxID=1943582 RepID=A0A1T1D2Z9_9SYNE|nr:hypothetical protein BV61_01250 [Candidatus Synechococcus spongiarum LMB bulk15M]
MKLHIGVDDGSGLMHSMATTGQRAYDLAASEELLHGEKNGSGLMRNIRVGSSGFMAHCLETVKAEGRPKGEQEEISPCSRVSGDPVDFQVGRHGRDW